MGTSPRGKGAVAYRRVENPPYNISVCRVGTDKTGGGARYGIRSLRTHGVSGAQRSAPINSDI